MDSSQQHDTNRTDQETAKAIKQFVGSHPDGVIATVTASGQPQASVVYFSVDDTMHFFFTTKNETRKAQNIGKQAHVSVAIHDAATQTVVKLAGLAEQMSDAEETLEVYRKSIHGAQASGPDMVPPIARITAGEFVAYKITPDFLDFTTYSHGDSFANALEHANDQHDYGDPS